jgi:hypothetical protein
MAIQLMLQTAGGLVAPGVSGSGARWRERRLFIGARTRLFGEGLENSDNGAVSGQNSDREHCNYCEK